MPNLIQLNWPDSPVETPVENVTVENVTGNIEDCGDIYSIRVQNETLTTVVSTTVDVFFDDINSGHFTVTLPASSTGYHYWTLDSVTVSDSDCDRPLVSTLPQQPYVVEDNIIPPADAGIFIALPIILIAYAGFMAYLWKMKV